MIFKGIPGLVKDVDSSKRQVLHRWSAFGNRDSQGDIIPKGAYAKTIRERGPGSDQPRIKFLYMHDSWEPVGVPIKMEETDEGLDVLTQIGRTPRANDLLLQYEDGIITEHSVGIDILKRGDPEVGEDPGLLKELRLWEGSAVTFGANPLTPVLSLLADPAALGNETTQIAGRMAAVRSLISKGITDDLAAQLEIQLSVWEAQLRQLALVEEVQPMVREAEKQSAELLDKLSTGFEALSALRNPTPDSDPRSVAVPQLESLRTKLKEIETQL